MVSPASEIIERIDLILGDKYCARCDSTIGFSDYRPSWCDLCWSTRRQIGTDLKRVLVMTKEFLEEVERCQP